MIISKGRKQIGFVLYCSHLELDSDKERDFDENTDDTGDGGTKRGAYSGKRTVDVGEETRETEIPLDSPPVRMSRFREIHFLILPYSYEPST